MPLAGLARGLLARRGVKPLFIDGDGPLFNFDLLAKAILMDVPGFTWADTWLRANYDIQWTDGLPPQIREALQMRLRAAEPWRCIQPQYGAAEAVAALRAAAAERGYDVYLLTAPYSGCAGWHDARLDVAARYYDFDAKHVVFASSDAKAVIATDGILIEDRWSTLRAWLRHPETEDRRVGFYVNPNQPLVNACHWSIPRDSAARLRLYAGFSDLAGVAQYLQSGHGWPLVDQCLRMPPS